MAVQFHRELDNMSTADFFMRMEYKPPKIKESTTRLTRSPLKGHADFTFVSEQLLST